MAADLFDPGHPDSVAEGAVVGVLTTQPIDRILDYRAPEGGCAPGDLVEVPLGPRKVPGVVWGTGQGDYPVEKLRRISRVIDAPPLGEELRDFITRAAAYTVTPLPAMLRLALRAPGLLDPPAMRRVLRLGGDPPARMTEPRARVLEVLETDATRLWTPGELATEAGVSGAVINGLIKSGAVREEAAPRDLPYPPLDPSRDGIALTAEQAESAARLRAAAATGRYGTTLLKGVTGSGKTEVYLEAVAEALKQGRQALVLLPEIALTGEFLTRVEERFGARPAEWHSGVGLTERRRCWKMAAEGEAQLVVGARSALFLPFRDLGLIVVDEEHDTSYKQEDGVLYNARDMAVLRALHADAQVILASATPSLESWVNAEAGKYARETLSARPGAAVLPQMRAIDMRGEAMPAGKWISPSLAQAVEARLAEGEQALLFLNRRGFAPVTVCRACGAQVGCPNCDTRMVEHRFLKRLMCHQCGETAPLPDTCPSCKVEGKLAAVGPGIERLAEEAAERFPEARRAVLSSDLFGSARGLREAIAQIAEGGADIIIGTQMVAKGHNFPKLTLVGVIDADLGLQGSDLRAAERTFQLVRQVAGRAGRADKPGTALVQTHQPEHPVIRAILSGDEEGFWSSEAREREMAAMPPFTRLAGIILSGTDVQAVFDLGAHLARNTQPLQEIGAQVFGPAPAPIARVRGRHRVRLLVRAARAAPLQAALARWVAPLRLPGDTRLAIDIDPQSFL